MTSTRWLATALLSLSAGAVVAQPAVTTSTASAAAATPASSASGGDLKHTVIEDDGVRIEETRWRGQARRITVQSKVGGARPYEIIVGPGGRDPSQERGAAGQSAWHLLAF